jgi:hypothetical protein
VQYCIWQGGWQQYALQLRIRVKQQQASAALPISIQSTMAKTDRTVIFRMGGLLFRKTYDSLLFSGYQYLIHASRIVHINNPTAAPSIASSLEIALKHFNETKYARKFCVPSPT